MILSPGMGLPRTVVTFKFEFAPELTYTTKCHLRIRVSSIPAPRARLIAFAFVMDEGDVELEAIPQSLIADIAAQYPGLKALNLSGNSEPHHVTPHHAHAPSPVCSCTVRMLCLCSGASL